MKSENLPFVLFSMVDGSFNNHFSVERKNILFFIYHCLYYHTGI